MLYSFHVAMQVNGEVGFEVDVRNGRVFDKIVIVRCIIRSIYAVAR